MFTSIVKSAVAAAMIAILPAACAVADPSEDDIGAEDGATEESAMEESATEENIAKSEQELSWSDCLVCGNGYYCNGNYELVKGTNMGGWCSWSLIKYCPKGCHKSACGSNDYCNP
jgi:hypothetical protein